jgi:hypothetical protein
MAEIYLTKEFINLPFYEYPNILHVYLHLLLLMDKDGIVKYSEMMWDRPKLGISYEVFNDALERLQNVHLISIDDSHKFIQVENHTRWCRK